MKKKFLSKSEELPRFFLSLALLVVFLSSFVQITSRDVVVLESLPVEYADKNPVTLPYEQLRDYPWFYSVSIVHYKDHTDTVILPPGAAPLTIEPEKVVGYDCCTKVMDNFMVDSKSGIFWGDWLPAHSQIPLKKQSLFCLRRLADCKPEEQLVLGAVPWRVRKKTSVPDYFDQMRDVTKKTDSRLESEIVSNMFQRKEAEAIFALRKGKSKLRPLLAHAAYAMFSTPDTPSELLALQEAQSIALYCDNWIIDGKKAGIPRSSIVIAGFHFRSASERLIDALCLTAERKEVLRKKFNRSNEMSYEGQSLEVERLNLDYIIENSLDKHEGVFCSHLYEDRCTFLNAPYAFSLWSGGYLAGASPFELDALWNMGLSLGTGLQMINDWHDMSPDNDHRFSDLHSERITLPYYLDMKMEGTPGEKIPAIGKRMREEVLHHYREALIQLNNLPDNQGGQLIAQALDVLVTSKHLA